MLGPYLEQYAKQHEPGMLMAKEAYDLAVKAVEAKYAP